MSTFTALMTPERQEQIVCLVTDTNLDENIAHQLRDMEIDPLTV